MSNRKGRQVRQRTSNRQAEVKPWGAGVMADLFIADDETESPMFGVDLMEAICERDNLQAALKRVRQNRGSPGVDGMGVDELADHLRVHWPRIKQALLNGAYVPEPVRRVEIPKPGRRNEKRKLGIPRVLDRFIQQAMLQILQSRWDATFSESSYGFRPGRSAHQAITQAQSHIRSGYGIVVDLDLEQFFDRVHHDRLMSRLAQEIADKRVLKLIRGYLQAGILENGLISLPTAGTPQGGPLSPFLSNVVLDEWDKELERRGHYFVRYGDDCNIYVKSRRAGERVKASVTRFLADRLKLTVNEAKSAVDVPCKRQFLGFSFTAGRSPNRRKIAPKSLRRFKRRIRQLTRRNWSISMTERIRRLRVYLIGWRGYFGFCETASVLRDLDSWLRHRLRCVQWKQWKTYRRRKTELLRLGVCPDLAQSTAWSAKGPWRISHTPGVCMALNNGYFDTYRTSALGSTR